MKRPDFYIGIDPGVNTGIAIWATSTNDFRFAHTYGAYIAMLEVSRFVKDCAGTVCLVFEDARKRKALPKDGFGNFDANRLQGAGSVKRDSAIWQECCEFLAHQYPDRFTWIAVAPNGKSNALAKNDRLFQSNTGIVYRTSIHARCAAMLVWKR